jgi:flagellar hook-associated protein 3 FlgL
LETAGAAATQLGTNITTQTSNLTSADLATTLTKLDQTQTAYQAALQSSLMIMNLSILNYINITPP